MTVVLHHPLRQNTVQDRILFVGLQHGIGASVKQQTCAQYAVDPLMIVQLQALSGDFLKQADPDLVICALFGSKGFEKGGDAVALIETLHCLGYARQIGVIAPPLPRPDLVQAELRALGPGARLILISDIV